MHQPVLLSEVIELMGIRPGGRYIDGTVGGGGHAAAILDASAPDGRLLALDRDPAAVERCRARLGSRATVVHGNFAAIEAVAGENGFSGADGILLDIGFSSYQVDDPERGLSFQSDGPLDMRLDPTQGRTAADLVNGLSQEELADVLFKLGEERESRRVARMIVEYRAKAPFSRTGELADVVSRAKGGKRGKIHPATQTFQALRIAVNDELENLNEGLEGAIRTVRPGGRVAVISFHSLEDRMVKQCVARHAGRWVSLPAGGQAWEGEQPAVKAITRKPVVAGETEQAANPRARSAKLRVMERI